MAVRTVSFSGSKDIPEPLPKIPYLARPHLGRLNLATALNEIREDQARRHRHQLAGGAAGMPRPERAGGPFGAPARPRQRRTHSQPAPPRVEATLVDRSEEPSLRRRTWEFLEPQDPRSLPNLHVERHAAITKALARQERAFAASRSELALRLARASDISTPTFEWDTRPSSLELSEQQREFFPRSIARVRQTGGGKDPRYCRPYDDVYIHREAVCRQKLCCSHTA